MIRKSLFLGAVLALSGTTYADIETSTPYEYRYTNNSAGIYSPGGAGTVGTQRYDLYLQNLALGKTTAASSVHHIYSSGLAVDGTYNNSNNNFYHSTNENKAWWKVNFADTAAGVDSVVIFDRSGFTSRLDDYQITIYDGDPDNGGTLVWSSDIFETSTTLRKEHAVPENISGTWLKIVNHVPESNTSNAPLTLCEVLIVGASENKAGVYGNQGEWLAPSFVSAGGSTLQIDFDFAGDSPVYDVLDVAGRYTAGGTLALNFLDTANIAAGDYQVVKAGQLCRFTLFVYRQRAGQRGFHRSYE